MAYTEFACRSGGSNLNAGTRTGDSTEPGTAADLEYASGDWVASTRVFTVPSGDPIADGVAVGDYASVYADGSTVTTFIGRVSARTTTTITIDASAHAGTEPTDGTGNRTLRIGGAWKGPNGSESFPWEFVTFGLENASGDHVRVNMKNDADYDITAEIAPTASQNFVTIQGYTTSYGDGGRATIDGGTTGTSFELLNPNANEFWVIDMIFQNNGATGSSHGTSPSSNCSFLRCVVASVRGIGFFGGLCYECEAYDCNQSNTGNWGGFYTRGTVNCISHDNTGNGFTLSGGSPFCVHCISWGNTDKGIRQITGEGMVINCDVYDNTNAGISFEDSQECGVIANCNVVKNGGYGIQVTAGAPHIINCGYGAGTQANTSGQSSLITGSTEAGAVTYPDDETPWNDPVNGDFTITHASAKNAGRGAYPSEDSSYSGTTTGSPDIGAAQAAASGGGGGGLLRVGMNGGIHG